ncbi:MAG: GNAT family N-acetyltransferase [Solirubrobacteraceae bacterium]
MAGAEPAHVLRMRIDLDPAALQRPRWPHGVTVRTFRASDAAPLHSLLTHAYRHGGGRVARFGAWLPTMTGDDEYDPALWFLAEADTDLVPATLCWTSAFVKDLAVHESWRGRGLGEALMRHAIATFPARGAGAVELKVHANNGPAVRLYKRLGMQVVEHLAP